MIVVKTQEEIALMRKANQITGDALKLIEEFIKPGVTTKFLDNQIREFFDKCGAKPGFLGVDSFPGAICASIDNIVVHGIPSDKITLEEGQIISIDTGAKWKGFNGDAARTFAVGKISEEKQKLVDVTRECFFKGIEILKAGVRTGDLGHAIQYHAESNGYSVVRELTGHGIGKELHEDPAIPNYGMPGRGVRLVENMTIAIEPMINMGKRNVQWLEDTWAVSTVDGLPSAHYENTVLIKEDGVEILSLT